jgi:thymidylate synthase
MNIMRSNFQDANEAFVYFYDFIRYTGINFDNTKALFNVGFTIHNPLHHLIHADFRKWNSTYAEREWQWYLSGDPSAEEIAKYAPIWYKHMDDEGCVNSNYGWQWKRNKQLDYILSKLEANPNTRHAAITIYDAKEWPQYYKDTPCTYAVQFTILNDKLNMSVLMRSNDLWFGFCNDQYCFSMLHKKAAEKLKIEIGEYYHFAHNLHLYNDKLNEK